ncbi:hypothetical protein FSP39_013302 [Pinctada imbricata]|uniref:Mutator-like transposase domain-containing protein n=1 Tax=Pinctada imbricata TaxID=66713 RepID=A0AA89C4J0_PINIB|nr:hypothetical protein FSP39_013302 [Pinctada imbricata]
MPGKKKRGRISKLDNTPFQKGNQFWRNRKSSEDTESPSVPAIIRPSFSVFDAVTFSGGEDNTQAQMILRPEKPSTTEKEDKGTSEKENFITNSDKINILIQTFLDKHDFLVCKNAKPTTEIVKRVGLGISLSGPNDIRFMLASLNIQPPSLTWLQKNLNSSAQTVTEVNRASMTENQEFVRRVQELKGQGQAVDIEIDTSYNNRMQSGTEAAIMSLTPVAECSTKRRLVLTMNIRTKQCTKRSCDHSSCGKIYPTDKSMMSSEAVSAEVNINTIRDQKILNIRSVTTDQSAKVEKVM